MNAEKVLKSISFIVNTYSKPENCPPEVQDLIQECKAEIAMAEQKKAGKAGRFKAALKSSKQLRKQFIDSRPRFAGAFIGESGKQYLTNLFYAVRFDEPLDGLVMAADCVDRPPFDNIIDNYNSSLKADLPPLAEIKTKFKTDKAEGKLDKQGRCLIEIDGRWYDAKFLIPLYEMVEPTEAYFKDNSDISALVMIGDGAQGVILPVRRAH